MRRTALVLVFVLGWLAAGCDSGSGPARFASDMVMSLVHVPGVTDFPWQLDEWSVTAGVRDNIYSAAFGYALKMEAEVGVGSTPVGGIRVDAYVLDSFDWGSGDDRYCIWDKKAPNGEYYGFVKGYPEDGATWDWDEQHARAITNPEGMVAFFIGLGDPEFGTDPGWAWPVTTDSMIATGVKVKFVAHTAPDAIELEVWMAFVRAQYQDFNEPYGGVIGNSVSYLTPYNIDSVAVGESVEFQGERREKVEIPFESIGREESPESYPMMIDRQEEVVRIHGDEPWTYERGYWGRLIYDPNSGWLWVEPEFLLGVISPDPNVAGEGSAILSMSEPYAFFCDVTLIDAWLCKAFNHTVILMSKTAEGNDVSWRPVVMKPYGIDGDQVTMMSEYILPIDSPVGEGRYYDWWGYPGTLIYMVQDGYLEVKVDDFYGDFDFDGYVDLKDFALFADQWHKGMMDGDFDGMYDTDHDGWVTRKDLRVFVGNWLGVRP